MRPLTAECFGTFLIVIAFGFSSSALAPALLITVLVYITVHISGSHFNPVVSLAFWSAGVLSTRSLLLYAAAQWTGAVLAAFLVTGISGIAPQAVPPATAGPLQYTLFELLFGLLLGLIYLSLFLSRKWRGSNIAGLVIGIGYAALLTLGEPLSGAILNPALAVGSVMADLWNHGSSWQSLPSFLLAPLLGGLASSHLFRYWNQQPGHSLQEEAET
ncbi:MAG: aquaporin [Balneolaceae bacterium]